MFAKLHRWIQRRKLIRQIRREHPALKRLSGKVLIRRFIDNQLADQMRQKHRFEASLRNPTLFGRLIQYPAPESELFRRALLFVEVKPKKGFEDGSDIPVKFVMAPNTRQVIVPLSPLAKAVKSANLFQWWLTQLEEEVNQGKEDDPAMKDYLRITIDFYKEEIRRLTRERSQ